MRQKKIVNHLSLIICARLILLAMMVVSSSCFIRARETAPASAFPDNLNKDQRIIYDWTNSKFSNFLDNREFPALSKRERNKKELELIDTLKGPHTQDYYMAINTLGALKSAKAVEPLLHIAAEEVEKDNRDRWMAVRSLGIIGDRSVIPSLIPLIYHPNINTRFWAQISLVRMTGENFGTDWQAWGAWWNKSGGKPPFDPKRKTWSKDPQLSDEETLRKSDQDFIDRIQGKQKAQSSVVPPHSTAGFAIPMQANNHFEAGTWEVMPTSDGRLRIATIREWSDTFLDVKAGQKIQISAEGNVHGSPRSGDWAYGPWGADGMVQGDGGQGGVRYFALVGKIDGTSPQEFVVGKHLEIEAKQDGRLYLGMADTDHYDNSGEFVATVSIDGKQVDLKQLKVSKLTAPTGNLISSMTGVNGVIMDKGNDQVLLTAVKNADCPMIRTSELFQPPLAIHMRAKTDSTNIRIFYGAFGWGQLIFNWEVQQDQLRVHDPGNGQASGIDGAGKITAGEWHDFVWEIQKDSMRVLVDGQERHARQGDYANVISPVGIGPAWGSKVEVSSVEIAPLK